MVSPSGSSVSTSYSRKRVKSFPDSTETGRSARIFLLMADRSIAVFDLGGVLIDWDPRYLYRKLFDGDTKAMEEFLATVCTQSWNEEQDAGRARSPMPALH